MDIEDSISQLQEHFDGKPWFGASIWESLEKIPVAYWDAKPSNANHSIAELVCHMIDWRGFAIERINGNESYSIELNSTQDWREGVSVASAHDKQVMLDEFAQTHEQLCELLAAKPDAWMTELVAGGTYTNEFMIRGVLSHDLYHLGQINLLHQQSKQETA